MKEKSNKQLISISLMLFAMFFGAGNMIFPPMLGHMSGTNYLLGTFGFIVTDAGLSILGIAAIVHVGNKISDLGALVGPKFAIFFGMLVYLLIGPLFALPRTGTVSYSMVVEPFLDGPNMVASFIFTAIFFGLTYILCLNPSKIVDIVGKILTPILLICIAVIFFASVFFPVGEIGAPQGDYATQPFFKGVIEGYLALDGMGALAFAIVVIDAMKERGLSTQKEIAKNTLIAGIAAGIGLGIVYLALGYVGAQTSSGQAYENGSVLLTSVVNTLLGPAGMLFLGLAVLFACLTTSIGLASSFSNFVNEIYPKHSYKKVLTIVCLFSFAVSNIGLTRMIAITLPALIMVYPPVIVLIFTSFAKKFLGSNPEPYAFGMLFAVIIGFFDGLKAAGYLPEGLHETIVGIVPWFDLGIGWIIPSIIGVILGLIVRKARHGKFVGA